MSRAVPFWRFGDPVAPLVALLGRGGVLAIPTESSYALAVPPGNAAGVAAIYRLKGRDRGKPLPVVIGGLEQLAGLGIAPDLPILKLLSAFWPGPLTAVLPIAGAGAAGAPPAAAGTGTLAIRIPGHPQLLDLLSRLGHGLTATSANRSGGEPVLDPRQAAALLAGQQAMVVDGGRLPGGPPSTLVALAGASGPHGPLAAGSAGGAGGGRGAGDDGAAGAGGDFAVAQRGGDGDGIVVLRAGRLPVERLRERLRVVRVASAGTGTAPGARGFC